MEEEVITNVNAAYEYSQIQEESNNYSEVKGNIFEFSLNSAYNSSQAGENLEAASTAETIGYSEVQENGTENIPNDSSQPEYIQIQEEHNFNYSMNNAYDTNRTEDHEYSEVQEQDVFGCEQNAAYDTNRTEDNEYSEVQEENVFRCEQNAAYVSGNAERNETSEDGPEYTQNDAYNVSTTEVNHYALLEFPALNHTREAARENSTRTRSKQK